MKRIIIILLLICISAHLKAQQWLWADLSTKFYASAIVYGQASALGASSNHIFWAEGDTGRYVVRLYDTSSLLLDNTVFTGNFTIKEVKADASGNWYLLLSVQDSALLAGGTVLRNYTDSCNYFICRINSGVHGTDWAIRVGQMAASGAQAFTLSGNYLYLAADSAGYEADVCSFQLATGMRTVLFHQPGYSIITSIAVDSSSNILLAGENASAAVRFGAYTPPHYTNYDAYLVKYSPTGTHLWSYMLNENRNQPKMRKVLAARANLIYYSGAVCGPLVFGGDTLSRQFSGNTYMASALDSNGHILWVTQPRDTPGSGARIFSSHHAVVAHDGSLLVASSVQHNANWGNGVTTYCPATAATIVHYTAAGYVLSASSVVCGSSLPDNIITDGRAVMISGQAGDPGNIWFGAINKIVLSSGLADFCARFVPGSSFVNNLETISASPAIQLYPNPARERITVTGLPVTGASVSITNLCGMQMRYSYTNGEPQTTISTGLPAGMYSVTINSCSYTTTLPLLIVN